MEVDFLSLNVEGRYFFNMNQQGGQMIGAPGKLQLLNFVLNFHKLKQTFRSELNDQRRGFLQKVFRDVFDVVIVVCVRAKNKMLLLGRMYLPGWLHDKEELRSL